MRQRGTSRGSREGFLEMTKIMIVDDSLFMRNRLDKLLTKHGYETTMACDGVEAVRAFAESRPDVVLMDITMPRKDGLEALAEIRQIDPQAKAIMLTALDQPLMAGRAALLGAKDFISKPVRPGQLLTVLEKVAG
jgi:two-component system chemotaxis response regulator CheY